MGLGALREGEVFAFMEGDDEDTGAEKSSRDGGVSLRGGWLDCQLMGNGESGRRAVTDAIGIFWVGSGAAAVEGSLLGGLIASDGGGGRRATEGVGQRGQMRLFELLGEFPRHDDGGDERKCSVRGWVWMYVRRAVNRRNE